MTNNELRLAHLANALPKHLQTTLNHIIADEKTPSDRDLANLCDRSHETIPRHRKLIADKVNKLTETEDYTSGNVVKKLREMFPKVSTSGSLPATSANNDAQTGATNVA